MDKTYFSKAIILKREPFRERDSRVTVYTDSSGFLELVARGTQDIKSKLAGHIEPFNQVDIMVIKGKKWDYLGAATAREVFMNLKSDTEKIIFSGDLFKILTRLIKPGISDEYIYDLIIEYLKTTNQKENNISAEYLSRMILLKFISHLGYQPVLTQCVVCGKRSIEEKIIFSPEKSGIVCINCQDSSYSITVSKATLDQLNNSIQKNSKEIINIKINKNTETECVKLINAFYRYHF